MTIINDMPMRNPLPVTDSAGRINQAAIELNAIMIKVQTTMVFANLEEDKQKIINSLLDNSKALLKLSIDLLSRIENATR